MGVKVGASCLHWSQTLVPHPPPCYSSPPSSSSSSSSPFSSVNPRRRRRRSIDGVLTCRVLHRSPFLGGSPSGLVRSSSLDDKISMLDAEPAGTTLRRAVSASLTSSDGDDADDDDDYEFARRLQELALRCQGGTAQSDALSSSSSSSSSSSNNNSSSSSATQGVGYRDLGYCRTTVAGGVTSPLFHPASYSVRGQSSLAETSATPPPWLGIRPEPPDWVEDGRREIVPAAASVERNAASVDLPLSLRILKRKKRWESEGWIREAGESAACSVKKALSSLVFIIREMQSYALLLRGGALFCDDSLQEMLTRVHREVHASFCWLFSHIFACTPTLMLSVMLLLANFTVYSMGHTVALSAPSAPPPSSLYAAAATVVVVVSTDENQHEPARAPRRYDGPSINSSSIGYKAAPVGGGGGGGGKVGGAVAGATDDGRWGEGFPSLHGRSTIIPDGISTMPSTTRTGRASGGEEEVVPAEDEGRAWSRIVEEAARMQAATRDEALMDHETLQQLVSPMVAEVVPDDDYPEYLRTELTYQQAVSLDPNNAMLLCNFAQFLYHVAHDHDRADYYFKRAVAVEPADAEALGQYANFLWLAKKDLGAAEETFLEAIAADPGNTVHAASYAHFLWNTGGDDTCYPLNGIDEEEP